MTQDDPAGWPIDAAMEWRRLGRVRPGTLASARRELHWAAQTLDGVGRALAEPRPNSQHIAFRWNEWLGLLGSSPIGPGWYAGLLPASAELAIAHVETDIETRFELDGRTFSAELEWVRDQFEDPHGPPIDWPPVRNDMPGEPFGPDERFGPPTDAHRELASWHSNAARLFAVLAAEEQSPHAGPTRILCWPHHFDIATFINLDPDKAPYEGRSVNVGMSPGDETYPAPYDRLGRG